MTATAATVGIEDLGPGNQSMFCLMSGIQVGDIFYIGSRNLKPTTVIGYDLRSRTVSSRHELGPGKFVQALACSVDGEIIYAGIVGAGPDEPNLFAITVGAPSGPARAVAAIPGLGIRDLATTRDGIVYAVGQESTPGLWACDPGNGAVRRVGTPAPGATEIRAVAATESTVFIGSGSELAGGGGASRSAVHAVDRLTGRVTHIPIPAMSNDPAIRSLAIVDGRLLVGSSGVGLRSHLAVVFVDGHKVVDTFEIAGKSVGMFHEAHGQVYFSAQKLHGYDMKAGTVAELPGDDGAERWAVGHHGGQLVVVSAAGTVRHTRPDSGIVEEVDLLAAGAPIGSQLGMSIVAGDGVIYLSGNGAVVQHRLDGRTPPRKLVMPGEAKSMQIVGGDLYLAQYNSQGIWRYRPGSSPEQVAALPVEQNRPQDTAWDSARGLLLMASENDTAGGGSLAAYDPAESKLWLHTNPLDAFQAIRAVAVSDGDCVIGGWNRYADGPRGEVACIDPVSGTVRWRCDPRLGGGISTLAVLPTVVVGVSMNARLFALDRTTGRLLDSRDVSGLVPGMTRMELVDGRLLVGSDDAVFAVDSDLSITVVADHLAGEWYSGPSLSADPSGNIYTLSGRNIVRLTAVTAALDPQHQKESVHG